jgi:type IV secretion system protein VirB10
MARRHEDPRTAATPAAAETVSHDIRPVVARTSAGLPWWILIAGMVMAGILLFSVLDARRRAATMPATRARRADATGVPGPVAPLFVPPLPPAIPAPVVLAPIAPLLAPRPAPPQTIYVPQILPTQPLVPPPRPEVPAKTTIDPVLVFDGGVGIAAAPNNEGGNAAAPPEASAPVAAASARASVIRHLPTLVPQGTLIPAVLESALDSTKPGPARALVSRDVRGFDGARVLIPRGSRLFGDYRADVEPGQNRALVTWTRLIRPDGVAIALASPAGDPLGRQCQQPFLRAFRVGTPPDIAADRRQPGFAIRELRDHCQQLGRCPDADFAACQRRTDPPDVARATGDDDHGVRGARPRLYGC